MTTSPDDVVTVVRDDGKEFLIKRSLVAEHINRGNFKVKHKADEPTLEERKKAVGFDLKKPSIEEVDEAVRLINEDDTIPEEKVMPKKAIESWTVAELKEEAARLGLEVPKSATKAKLVELITAKLQDIVDTEMEDREVTQEDLDNNPDLVAEGVKVGDIIQIPKAA